MKKLKWIVVAIVAVIFLLGIVGFLYFYQDGGYQTVSLKGYSLLAPKDWEINREENTLHFKGQQEAEKGNFALLYQEADIGDIPVLMGFSAEDLQVRESNQYAVKVNELRYKDNGRKILQYVFCDLPAAPPYQAVLTLIDVRETVARRMLDGFVLPEIGNNAPEKPLAAPDAAFLENAAYIIWGEEENKVFQVKLLENLLAAHNKETDEKNVGLPVLAYKQQGEEAELSSWYYLQVSEDATRLFTYYQAQDGSYIYDNDPKIIKQLTKESAPEEGYTRYLADGLLLLEIPYNQYTENKDALLEQASEEVKDVDALSKLVRNALPVGVSLGDAGLETENLKLAYTLTDENRYIQNGVLEETPFYQNALVLFSLMENVDVITMDIQSPADSYKLTYRRNAAEKQFENKDITEFSKTEESFEAFVEEIPQMTPPPAAAEDSSGKTSGAKIIKSKTFTVGSGSKVPHPETGKLVTVDKYAERYGVSRYLDAPITVEVFEQIVDGETKLWAKATSNGSYIASYPFSSYEEMESMFAMLP